jgi:hypothetical protein
MGQRINELQLRPFMELHRSTEICGDHDRDNGFYSETVGDV